LPAWTSIAATPFDVAATIGAGAAAIPFGLLPAVLAAAIAGEVADGLAENCFRALAKRQRTYGWRLWLAAIGTEPVPPPCDPAPRSAVIAAAVLRTAFSIGGRAALLLALVWAISVLA
jgi:hypothetical protein